ncbi:hypothetical protein ACJZ2D_005973 [Fusarium nematophilum]
MAEYRRHLEKIEDIGPYKHQPLESPLHICPIHLLPGRLGDGIQMQVAHAHLDQPQGPKSNHLSRSELQTTLPPGWEVFETPEGRYLLCYDPEGSEDESEVDDGKDGSPLKTLIDPSLYALPPDEEVWAREPTFQALSYVWGSQDDPELAFVESAAREAVGAIKLGKNLAAALQDLRHEDKRRTLWVDAICINQTDDDENSTHAEERTWYDIDVDLSYPDSIWSALDRLARRPWFARVWTVREILLANRLAVLQCRKASITWSLFRRAVECVLDKKTLPKCRAPLMSVRTSIVNGAARPLAQVLERHNKRGCFDPHDKAYGMLAMTPPKLLAAITPNYKEPVEETYKSAFLAKIDAIHRWELQGCTPDVRSIEAPSWVPDLSEVDYYCYGSNSQLASGCSSFHFQYESPGKLKLKGVRFDPIQSVGRCALDPGSLKLRTIRSWEPPNLLTASYSNGRPLLDVFAITLMQHYLRERHPIEKGWPTLPELRRFCRNKLLFSDYGKMLRASHVYDIEWDHWPRALGCKTSLRLSRLRAPNATSAMQEQRLQLHQQLLCARPRGLAGTARPPTGPWLVQIFDHFDQEFRWYPRFFNPETNTLTAEDPRLGPLEGWERIPLEELGRELTGDDPQIYGFFGNTVDGRVVDSDPRMTPEALEARGVKLETFTLI